MKKPDDVARFAKMLAVLQRILVGTPLEPDIQELYWLALEDLSIDAVERAGQMALKRCTFFPKPAELRAFVEGSDSDEAEKAWQLAVVAWEKTGGYSSVLFEDGAIAQGIAWVFGTWREFCEAMHPVFREAEVSFEERERARLERRIVDARQIQVGGLSPEMIRAKQKEFYSAYRRALREGKTKSFYVMGSIEADNRAKLLLRQIHSLPTRVFTVRRTGDAWMVYNSFDVLGDYERGLLLESPPVRDQLPEPPPRRQLAAGEDVPAPPEFQEAVKAATAAMALPSGPGLTEEELAERRAEIQRQLEQVKGGAE